MPDTHKEKISDTVELIPSKVPITSVTLADHIAVAAGKLVTTLQHYSTAPPPGIKIGDPIIQDVRQIANIFKIIYSMPASATSLPKPPSSIKLRPPLLASFPRVSKK